MAIFEKTSETTVLDDTENLICTIESAQNINKHTEYVLRVQRGPNKENRWNVSRRYRDFAALHSSLQQAHIELPLPPKKLIGNMQPSFVAERQIALQKYIDEVLHHQVLNLSLQVRSFLDPTNYSLAIAEQALQTVSIALRGDGQYELKGPLADIGWRIRKHYFCVTDAVSRTDCLLSWQNYGPDRSLNDKDLQAAFRSLQTLSHPLIDPVLTLYNLESGAYVVRRIHENGTIRDMLYGTEYSKNHLAKYGNSKVRKPFTMGQIAHYGYQILIALKFLHDKGLPHGHIHPGNIAIENQTARLLDLENYLLGVPCLYRQYLLELRRTSTAEAVDVHCFGRTLYEMAFAEPLDCVYRDFFPCDIVNTDLESVLRLCLSSTSVKHGGPSIEHLLSHTFFTCSGLTAHPRDPHLKFPLSLKDELRNAVTVSEARLKSDQKLVRNAKREIRIQEILSSEEQLRKHKRRAKKRESSWKSMSSLGDAAASASHSHSASTASSPTPPAPPPEPVANGNGAHTPATPDGNGRTALLSAICSFDKNRLARVHSNS